MAAFSLSAPGGVEWVKSLTVPGLYLPPDFDGRNLTGAVAVASTNGSGVWQSNDGGRTFVAALKSSSLDATVNSIVRVPGGGGLLGVAGEGPPLVPPAAVGGGRSLRGC